jgi:tryptophan synthase alpha chain
VSGDNRVGHRFAQLRREGRGGLITFVTAGDPDRETSERILAGLPAAGADLIELGMPFSDPMADGPAIQASSQRALKAGQTVRRTLAMVDAFRQDDDRTPVVLMGYYNPIYAYGVEGFAADAAAAGVDGLIVVDLPPEEADELQRPAMAHGLDLVYLTAPTTPDARLPLIVARARGFIYHVAITGVTGTRAADAENVAGHLARIRRVTELPIAVGFGIRTPEQAASIAGLADAAVVGSALVGTVEQQFDGGGGADGVVDGVLGLVRELAAGVRGTAPAKAGMTA